MAEEDLDLVVQLGDYIYEGAPTAGFRVHEGDGEPVTLGDYRNRYAQYKGDPDLQASRAAFPWVLVQEQWLRRAVAGPTGRWNVLAQQVVVSQRDFTSGPVQSFSNDGWDGYVADRNGLRDHLAAVGTSNPLILTGGVHANYVCDVKADFDDPDSATVATELVGTSISTGGDGIDQNPGDAVQLAENPHIRFINRNRGYVRDVVTASEWTADFRVVDQITTAGAPVRTRASYVIEAGVPGAQPA